MVGAGVPVPMDDGTAIAAAPEKVCPLPGVARSGQKWPLKGRALPRRVGVGVGVGATRTRFFSRGRLPLQVGRDRTGSGGAHGSGEFRQLGARKVK